MVTPLVNRCKRRLCWKTFVRYHKKPCTAISKSTLILADKKSVRCTSLMWTVGAIAAHRIPDTKVVGSIPALSTFYLLLLFHTKQFTNSAFEVRLSLFVAWNNIYSIHLRWARWNQLMTQFIRVEYWVLNPRPIAHPRTRGAGLSYIMQRSLEDVEGSATEAAPERSLGHAPGGHPTNMEFRGKCSISKPARIPTKMFHFKNSRMLSTRIEQWWNNDNYHDTVEESATACPRVGTNRSVNNVGTRN